MHFLNPSSKTASAWLTFLYLVLIPFFALAGPFDSSDPYDYVELLAFILTVLAVALLLILNLIIFLIIKLRKKKWTWKSWLRFNLIYLVVAPIMMYVLSYTSAYYEDGKRRNAIAVAEDIIEKYELKEAEIYDSDYYFDWSRFQHQVLLLHQEDSLPAEARAEINAEPHLTHHSAQDTTWGSYYKY